MNVTIDITVDGDAAQRVEYLAFKTDAPKSYDGFGTLNLLDCGSRRVVLIQREHFLWQQARYASGLHLFEPLECTPGALQEIIWQRIAGKEAA